MRYRHDPESRKVMLSAPPALIREIFAEARRLGTSASWVIRESWAVAKAHIAQLPSAQQNRE